MKKFENSDHGDMTSLEFELQMADIKGWKTFIQNPAILDDNLTTDQFYCHYKYYHKLKCKILHDGSW
jgi:hypothetical protein